MDKIDYKEIEDKVYGEQNIADLKYKILSILVLIAAGYALGMLIGIAIIKLFI